MHSCIVWSCCMSDLWQVFISSWLWFYVVGAFTMSTFRTTLCVVTLVEVSEAVTWLMQYVKVQKVHIITQPPVGQQISLSICLSVCPFVRLSVWYLQTTHTSSFVEDNVMFAYNGAFWHRRHTQCVSSKWLTYFSTQHVLKLTHQGASPD